MSAIPEPTKRILLAELQKAMVDSTGNYEWLQAASIKFRLATANLVLEKDAIIEWMEHLVTVGKAEKHEQKRSLSTITQYRLVANEIGTLSSAEQRPPKPKADLKRRSPRRLDTTPKPTIPPESDWPDWVTYKVGLLLKERDELKTKLRRAKDENLRHYQKNKELELAIMTHQKEQSRALSIYGSPNALVELTEQVALSPKFADLTPTEHRFVASVGLASGLNPMFHLHAWKQNKRVKDDNGHWKTVKVLTILPDYKGLMAAANGPIMTDERRLTKAEMTARGIPQRDIDEGAIAYEFIVTLLEHAKLAKEAGLTYTPVKGYGWWAAKKDEEKWSKSERKYVSTGQRIPNDTPNARDGEWVAKKRAIRDAFNQVADLRLKFVQVEGAEVVEDKWQFTGDPDAIEGEFTASDSPPPAIDADTGEVLPDSPADAPGAVSSDVDDPDDAGQGDPVEHADSKTCTNCSEPALGDGPFPNLCKEHADKAANYLAAQQEG